jgi:FkbM family methyltransferase
MKKIIQSCFNAFGLRIIRIRNAPIANLEVFFSILKERGFSPKHIVDVGANHGTWTRRALNYFPSAHYTLVEPQDYLKRDVQDLLASNSKIRWIGAGAGDKQGVLPFTVSYHDVSSTFILTPDAAKGGVHQIEVPVTTLNEIVRSSDAPFPDMIKIDAEGFDLRVLAGASELIGKTDVFLLEATICATIDGSEAFENSLGNVIHAMADAGYHIIDITDLNRSPKYGVLWLCEAAFLRNGSGLLDGITYE